MPLQIGVDVGGTFTDLVCYDPNDGSLKIVKISSSPPDFHRAVIEAVGKATGGAAANIVHGSTVATNALLQRAGEPAAFITTQGFRDMLLIGRQNRPDLYALRVQRPQPLTDEQNWFTVRERISAAGEIVEPLDPNEVDRLVKEIIAKGLRHVAVCLLFSFVNPAHEKLIGARCEAAGLSVSLSCDVLPEFREYERASTTVINASLRPTVESYLDKLGRGLGQAEITRMDDRGLRMDEDAPDAPSSILHPQSSYSDSPAPSSILDPLSSYSSGLASRASLRIMHSSGGTLSVAQAGKSAARLVLSGPAGGVLGAAFVAGQAGFADIITYDMGGTSTDVATVLEGRPQWTTSSTIDGLPIALPMFDIHTVGAGGGSLAQLDAGGALRVGPRSAGAVPGPACYGRGGTEPTVTDANLVLGRILPDRFLGGAMRVDIDLARAALDKLARAMGKTITETAVGIIRVAEANMEHAIRAVTSRRGHDPRRFTLVSFGGAGGLHACALASALEIGRVLIPPYCGVLSALGMVVAPPVADASKTVVHLGEQLDDARLAAEFGAVSMETIGAIPYEQTAAVEAYADVRFRGQSHEVKVRAQSPSNEQIKASFLKEYETLYGKAPVDRPIEIVTLRVRRIGRQAEIRLPELEQAKDAGADQMTKLIDSRGSETSARVMTRAGLRAKGPMNGPLLLIDSEATCYVPTGWQASASETGQVILERDAG
ncbi:MAG TPA: hydantoinase/oxoprolinase family protein [Humisphaera sp.]|jgi:N-methylhydantoinase A|nr:hydantoinase/oxoprolinase family protein [Humisphaera sp.]